MFFFNLEIFRSSLLQQSPSNLRCYSGVLPLVVPVAPFHQLKHDEMRGWICLVLQCWVIFVSWLNEKISVGWNVRPECFEKRESGCQCFNEHFLPSETARPSFIDWKTAGHLFSSPKKHQIIKEGPENPIDLAMTQTNISTAGSVVKPFKPPFSSI